VWAALADPTRRRLLDQLSRHGPLTATELAPDYPVSRQALVKHLGALSVAGLVTTERRGREVRYRVVSTGLEEAVAWLSEVGALWDVRLTALRDRFGDR
jgi:DNA-binding transcriptional ArsR family regulator